MLTPTEDSIRSLSDENSENLVNTLASAKLALEQLYESGGLEELRIAQTYMLLGLDDKEPVD